MVRVLRAAAAQMGPTQKADTSEHTLALMLDMLEEAAGRGASLVVFPELAFTTFFPRWLLEGEALDRYFERSMPNPAVAKLCVRARATSSSKSAISNMAISAFPPSAPARPGPMPSWA